MRPAPSRRGRVAVASTSPRPKAPAHRILTATPRHAVLAVEGDTIEIVVPGARGRATVVGPDVPDRDQGTFQDTARVRFDVTFAAVRGSLPLARSMFTVTDGQRDRLSRAGGLRHTVGTR